MMEVPKWKLDTRYSDDVKRVVFEAPTIENGGVLKLITYTGNEAQANCFHLDKSALKKASGLRSGDQIRITECTWDEESDPTVFYICDFDLVGMMN